MDPDHDRYKNNLQIVFTAFLETLCTEEFFPNKSKDIQEHMTDVLWNRKKENKKIINIFDSKTKCCLCDNKAINIHNNICIYCSKSKTDIAKAYEPSLYFSSRGITNYTVHNITLLEWLKKSDNDSISTIIHSKVVTCYVEISDKLTTYRSSHLIGIMFSDDVLVPIFIGEYDPNTNFITVLDSENDITIFQHFRLCHINSINTYYGNNKQKKTNVIDLTEKVNELKKWIYTSDIPKLHLETHKEITNQVIEPESATSTTNQKNIIFFEQQIENNDQEFFEADEILMSDNEDNHLASHITDFKNF
jgi:hypothetical protein